VRVFVGPSLSVFVCVAEDEGGSVAELVELELVQGLVEESVLDVLVDELTVVELVGGLAGSGRGTWSGHVITWPGLSHALSVGGITRPGLSMMQR
jgi:hypothetical protein